MRTGKRGRTTWLRSSTRQVSSGRPRRLVVRRLRRHGLPASVRRRSHRRHRPCRRGGDPHLRRSTTSGRDCSRTHRKCAFPTCSRTSARLSVSSARAPPGRSTTRSWLPRSGGTWSCRPPSAARCLARARWQRRARRCLGSRARDARAGRRDRAAVDGGTRAHRLPGRDSLVVRRRRPHAVLGGIRSLRPRARRPRTRRRITTTGAPITRPPDARNGT